MANNRKTTTPDDEGLPDLSVPVGPAEVVTLPLDHANGYGDAELTAMEQLEELSLEPEEIDGGASANDAEVAALREKTERLAEVVRDRHAARVHRKVSAAVVGGGIAGAIPALLEAVDGLQLPASVQPFAVLAAAILGLFAAAYATPEREAPEV
jgi:hypothetical protein